MTCYLIARDLGDGALELYDRERPAVVATYRGVDDARMARFTSGVDPAAWPIFAVDECGLDSVGQVLTLLQGIVPFTRYASLTGTEKAQLRAGVDQSIAKLAVLAGGSP